VKTERVEQPWSWICEFCFLTLPKSVTILPPDWDWAWQAAICPECRPRVAQDGGYAVVPGGKYASIPDPREVFSVRGLVPSEPERS
jgi:hypothetical protein